MIFILEFFKLYRHYIVFFLVSIFTGLIATIRGSDLLGLFFVTLNMFLVLCLLFFINDRHLRNILIIAILIRLGLSIFQAYIAPLPDSGADAVTFERIGWENAQAWLAGGEAVRTTGAYIYSAWIGVLYYLFGRVQLIAQFMNVLAGLFIVFLIYKLTMRVTELKRCGYIAGLVAAFYPTLNLYSAITMRECFIVLFSLLSIYSFIVWVDRGFFGYFGLAVLTLIPASSLHGGITLVGLVYVFFYCFYSPTKKRWMLFSWRLLPGIVISAGIIFLFGDLIFYKLPSNPALLFSPEFFKGKVAVASRSRAAYLVGFSPSSLLDVLWHTPIRILYLLFTPFPWMIKVFGDLFAFAEAFICLFLVWYSVNGFSIVKRKNKAQYIALLLILIVLMIVFSWGTSNYGTAIRHRQKFVSLLIVGASCGIYLSSKWNWLFPEKRAGKRIA
ncbi:MAG TPA: hypothetical protein GX004_07920 [Firmicutes bacterium]|jgi:hypothetical protein|nr:hypothetical protein [Bacillota bacterium]